MLISPGPKIGCTWQSGAPSNSAGPGIDGVPRGCIGSRESSGYETEE
jgi:hypothetical protein